MSYNQYNNTNHFYPRSPYGERHKVPNQREIYQYFYPRSPYGERLPIVPAELVTLVFLSTLSLRRATLDGSKSSIEEISFLSTLSLRRATAPSQHPCPRSRISIHALLTESDREGASIKPIIRNFYPRSPYGERLSYCACRTRNACISIHALLTESDPGKVKLVEPGLVFLSTLSLRRATFSCVPGYDNLHISIHALLTESDSTSL